MAQKQYSRSIARLVLVAGMCFTAIGLCSVSASAIDDTELLQPVAIKEDSLQPIGQSVLLADVSEENWYEGTSGSLYYCYADGTYATGITTLPNEETYLFALDGTLKTGWQTIHGKTYYFDSEGAMAVGTVTIGGTKYEFNSSGALKEETKNEGLYQITGTSSVTVSQMVKYYNTYSSIAYPSAALTKGGAADIETFCKIIKEEADAENMKADVVFIQAMLETGYLKFGGDVKISQFNFAGLGATGNGVAGNSFKDVRTGIRAQVQHLKAYANKEALKNTCVDVRFFYVTRGSAPYVEWLGIQENPNGGGWAASKNYGNDLLGLINKLKAI